jgi:mRNA interferase RelE/StbE
MFGGNGEILDLHVQRMDTENMATVRLTAEAYEQLDRLPKVINGRVWKLIKRLESWPDVSGAKPLSGNLAGWYRLRTGDYRLRFQVKGEEIVIDKVGHRRDFYED